MGCSSPLHNSFVCHFRSLQRISQRPVTPLDLYIRTLWTEIVACRGRRRRSLGRRGTDHQLKALLGGRKLGDVMLWMCPPDMFLHGSVSLFLLIQLACYYIDRCKREGYSGHCFVCSACSIAQYSTGTGRYKEFTHSETTLPTARAILVAQGTDNFIISLRHGEGGGQRSSRRHGGDG